MQYEIFRRPDNYNPAPTAIASFRWKSMARIFWLALLETNPAAERLFEIRVNGQTVETKLLEMRKGYAKT